MEALAPALTHDLELIEEDAVDVLVQKFNHRVRYFAHRIQMRYRLDPQWRDDLISAGYWGLLKAVRNRRSEAHERELSAYVSTRIEGAVMDEARRILTRVTNESDIDLADLDSGAAGNSADAEWEMSLSCVDPEEQADRNERWRTIEASIGHLTEDHRELLRAYSHGYSISEIARSGGVPASRLQNQLSRISRQLRAKSPELRRLLRHEI